MKDIYLDKYVSAWKKDQNFDNVNLSEPDILRFLHANSKNIGKLFKTGLSMDIILKSILAASFIGVIFLFPGDTAVITASIFLIAVSIASVFYQVHTYRQLPYDKNADARIRETLQENIDFYNRKYIRSLLIGALSNAMIFISGMMYYFYFKYGKIKAFELDDYIVTITAIILSFLIGAVAQIRQHNFHISQLEACLQEIDDDTINVHSIRERKNRRRRKVIIILISLVLGLLLFSYLLMR